MPKHMHFRDFIQIAGVRDIAEAKLLTGCGVRYLGFPLRLPVNQEDLSEAEAASIIRALRPPAYGVAITYQDDADEVSEFMEYLGASLIQLHGDISLKALRKLRRIRPDIKIIKSLVIGERSHGRVVAAARALGPFVDAFITDTYDPATGASGATGKTHDWKVSRELAGMTSTPVILAGGLSPANVRAAILAAGPAGVDVHTGVEDSAGRKDALKVRSFLSEAHAGFSQLRASRGTTGGG